MKSAARLKIKKFKRLLVANRGEIAIRVFRAATELGIGTVAIYTYEDRYSLHRFKADEAYQIGANNDPLKPYLDIHEIIKLARHYEIDAIHPGYGFLSENVEFARSCAEAGIVFIGPEPEAMQKLGNKIDAKKIAEAAGIPMIADSRAALIDVSVAQTEAKRIGFPILLKAAAGGGGRGMRVVNNNKELQGAFNDARREAERAFGDGTLFIEKYIDNPKHLEVQIIGDQQGNLVHLFERDCSVQRRFQKVVEVAPSFGLQAKTRQKLYAAALKMAQAVNYSNAGTVEFLLDQSENIYFIEVNPRIQVEHTVTEEVTGIDIVRSQILIAMGHSLHSEEVAIPVQSEIKTTGFAVQCRITTEDPLNDFKPDYGRLIAYRSPGGHGIRLDGGSAYAGTVISPLFDSLLVKITARGQTLDSACVRLVRALQEFRIRGVEQNIPFLLNVVRHPVFRSGAARVKFIEQHPEVLKFKLGRDRATKVCHYLADVVVNGNPDVAGHKLPAHLRTPAVPEHPRFEPYPDGTRQKLEKLGRAKFIDWLKNESSIQYTDTTFRDAHQSLLATRVRSYDLLNIAESYARHFPQTFSMEVWGGATFDVALRFLHECPWERLKLLRQAIPNILLQMLFRGSNGVGYSAYPDNLIQKFICSAAETGIDIFRIFDSLNWLDNMVTSIKTVREETNSLAEVSICYTGDILNPQRQKYNLQYYLDLARRIEDAGAHILAIKDMAGLLKPYAAEQLITALKQHIEIPIHLHTHDTSSVQSATLLKAVEAGVDVVDVALASMSGLTSQPNFNSMVASLVGQPREQAFDLEKLNQFSDYWEAVRSYYQPFESELRAGTAEIYDHEIPGGQYSNLRPQARGLGLEDQFDTIKKNYVHVNNLLGDLVKVTPSSKMVGDLALFMTSNKLTPESLLAQAAELPFPESVVEFFRGDLGQPFGGFPAELQAKVLKGEKPYTGRANEHLQPIDLKQEFKAFQEEFGTSVSELDFLSYQLYPKVYKDYHKFQQDYGRVSNLPTRAFFYGLQADEEVQIELEPGKRILVRLVYVGKANEQGQRSVSFQLNGQSRTVEVKDSSIKSARVSNSKASLPEHIAAPLQGKLGDIFVSTGSKVEKDAPLFVIEAMKMETSVTAPRAGKVEQIILNSGSMVESGDIILILKDG